MSLTTDLDFSFFWDNLALHLLDTSCDKPQIELEQMLLPEAEQIVDLSKTLTHQTQHFDQAQAEIAKLKRQRRLIKTSSSNDYPPNLDAHPSISVLNQKPELDLGLASYFRLHPKVTP